ncbi:TraB/VirB10 family protein [Geoalkalibacter halelectricus]|uniref:TraB/VirB10 family protein n=1 Tax=Geoalkalibacter halelectricus TaxID=2847045 RepID=A0ABY5ZL51_9BACT|nr:TraB/VirB10 family protein [Geoalkalibacter halelectricus]MDO3377082.1 TraB/VirB10 family protein [Geoalkalibacter halelectricus]UWZ79421.1 TraB/VirB10 family protein [Geoalkalibacter halelectricus]
MSLKDRWRGLSPRKKRFAVVAAVSGSLMLFAVVGVLLRGEKREPVERQVKPQVLTPAPSLLKKDLYQESLRDLSRRDAELSELRQLVEDIQREKQQRASAVAQEPGETRSEADTLQGPPEVRPAGRVAPLTGYPPPPLPLPGPGGAPLPAAPPPPEPVLVVGGIAHVSASASAASEDKKKASRPSVYLPPSFMAATLLSGLDAPTVEAARGNPVPVLLRVKELAVLPNSVKADLKGCFVIADGVGNLADERAHLQLVSLSCISRKGEAVIDQKVKGFVVDEDGKIGLKGQVVAKMGANIARSMLAGFFGGAADAISATSTVTSVSPLGTTQTIPSGDILRVGAASGISQGFKDVQKFYLDLAKQTMPVIEVGATKDITLVIQEGVTLEIRETGGGW